MDIRNIKIISLMIVCLLSINFVVALGVSSPYWKDHPLEISPGQTQNVAFTLVNRANAETAQAYVILDDGAGIAEIISGAEYTVIPGTTNTKVILKVNVPESASIGDIYYIRFSVKAAPEKGGTVQLSVKYNIDFPVKIVKEPAPFPEVPEIGEGIAIGWIILIIIITILIIIGKYLILPKKKKKK